MGRRKPAQHDQKQLTLEELPDELIRLTLMVAKTFYGNEHYIVVKYVQTNRCIRFDALTQLIKFKARHLRRILRQLKLEKIIRIRLINEYLEKGYRRHHYYYINYSGMFASIKYKICYIRRRLEAKDKKVADVAYRCTGCGWMYETLDMNKIFNATTQELQCWNCNQTVESIYPTAPSGPTPISVTRFNHQIAPLFELARSLDGHELARYTARPPISRRPAKSKDIKMTTESGESAEMKENQPDKSLTDTDETERSVASITQPNIENWLDAEYGNDGEGSSEVSENSEEYDDDGEGSSEVSENSENEQISAVSDEEVI